jgi:hypothetical protein
MLCDKYKKALMEAAAGGAALPSAASEHVNVCAHCRQEFAAQESLFAVVDEALRTRANPPVGANFDHRVRLALQAQNSHERNSYALVLTSGSLAAAAAVLLAVLAAQSLRPGGQEAVKNSAAASKPTASSQSPVPNREDESLGPSSGRRVNRIESNLRALRAAKPALQRRDEPEVLVPAGQEELLAKYMRGFATRQAPVTFTADLQHEPNIKPAQVPSIEISEIVVEPLADLSSN